MATNINGDTGVDKIQAGVVEAGDLADASVTDAKIDTMSSSKLTGALPAIDGSALTGLSGGGFSNMEVFTSPGTWTNPGSVTSVKVTVVAGGGGAKQGNFATAGTGGTSSFGGFCSATGGAGGQGTTNTNFSAQGGVGSGGNLNLTGGHGTLIIGGSGSGGDSSMGKGARWSMPSSYTGATSVAGYGGGGATILIPSPGYMPGGGGGTSIEYIPGASIPGPVAVTVGAAGSPPPNMPAPIYNPGAYIKSAGAGVVIIEY